MRLLAESEQGDVIVTRGSTFDNAANLPARFLKAMRRTFSRSLLGRQELDGELIAEVEGALWSRALLETSREERAPECGRVVVGVDPPASAGGCLRHRGGRHGRGRHRACDGRCLGGKGRPRTLGPRRCRNRRSVARRPRRRRGEPGRRDGRLGPARGASLPCRCGWCTPAGARSPAPNPSPRSTKPDASATRGSSPAGGRDVRADRRRRLPGAGAFSRPCRRAGLGAYRTDARQSGEPRVRLA